MRSECEACLLLSIGPGEHVSCPALSSVSFSRKCHALKLPPHVHVHCFFEQQALHCSAATANMHMCICVWQQALHCSSAIVSMHMHTCAGHCGTVAQCSATLPAAPAEVRCGEAAAAKEGACHTVCSTHVTHRILVTYVTVMPGTCCHRQPPRVTHHLQPGWLCKTSSQKQSIQSKMKQRSQLEQSQSSMYEPRLAAC